MERLGCALKTVNTGFTEFAPEKEVMQKTSDPTTTHTVWLLCYNRLLPWGHQTPVVALPGQRGNLLLDLLLKNVSLINFILHHLVSGVLLQQ